MKAMQTLFMAGALLLAHAATAPAHASDMTVRDQVATELEKYHAGLGLSDYTWTQVEVILKSGIRERVAIAQKYGLAAPDDPPPTLDAQQRKQLEKELKASRKTTEGRMERYLDKDQMKQFEAFQDERYQAFLTHLEGSNGN